MSIFKSRNDQFVGGSYKLQRPPLTVAWSTGSVNVKLTATASPTVVN